MRPVDPTVTWANHTSMVTGVTPAQHGVIFNGLLIRKPGVAPVVEPWRDKQELVHGRTLYDAAHEKGLTTAQVDWVAILNAPSITWEFPERPDPKGAIAQEAVKAGILSQADLEGFASKNILWRDQIWTMAAAHIIRQHRPNLLLFHLLNLDSTQHRYGPRTPAAMAAMALLDTQVATILQAVQDSGIGPRTTVFVVSDHGFKAVKRQIRPNAVFAKAGLLKAEGGKVAGAQVYSVPEGGSALVYVTVPDEAGALLAKAKRCWPAWRASTSIVEAPEFAKYGLPAPTADRPDGRADADREGRIRLHCRCRRAGGRRCAGRKPRLARLCRERPGPSGAVHRFRARHQAGRHARGGVEPGSGADDRAAARSADAGGEGESADGDICEVMSDRRTATHSLPAERRSSGRALISVTGSLSRRSAGDPPA